MRRVLVVVLLALSGCLAEAPSEAPAATAPTGVIIDETRPDTAFTDIVTGPAVGPDENATLDAPPRLIAGEWWRIRFAPALGVEASEVVRVVAAVENDGYIIGMPHEGWFKEAISFHSPGFGDIALDLSYAVHNQVFQAVQFPLEEGATWETSFALTPFTATVESIEGKRAAITLTPLPSDDPTYPLYEAIGFGNGGGIRLVYDATMHEVVEFSSSIGGYEVLEHGYGFEGWVTIPRGEHTAIDYGQFGPATPGEPVVTRSIEVAGGFNRMTLMHAVFPATPGAYRVRSVAPDGTEFMTESIGTTMTLAFYEAKDPDGIWSAEDLVAGGGATYSMGIAYHQYDISLPDGARRSDHSHEVVR